MKTSFVIICIFLFLSLSASNNTASYSVNQPSSDFLRLTNIIEQYYVDANKSKEISSQLKQKIFNWYINNCEHNQSDTLEDLNTNWKSIEQACIHMSKNNQRMIYNSILCEYDAAMIDITPYRSQQFKGSGLILSRKNGKINVLGTVENTSGRKLKIPYGTIIKSVNGESTANMCLEDVLGVLHGDIGTNVTITSDKNVSYTLSLESFSTPTVSHTIVNDKIIIKILTFDNDTPKNIEKILEQIPPYTNIVLDLCNNPGGLLNSIVDTLNLFIKPNTKLFNTISHDPRDNKNYISNYKTKYNPKTMYVLINQATSAGSLLFAKVLQKENAILLGNSQETISQIKVIIPLEGINVLKLPIAKFYFSDGTIASGTSIIADIPFNTESLDDEALYEKIIKIIDNH